MKRMIITITLSLLLILCNFTPILANEKSTPSGIPLSKMEEKIDEHVNKFIGKSTPGAAVAVIKDGKIIFSKGYGYGDVEKQTPVDPKSTIFEYGSISKLFIWTSAMKLSEEGKLDLNKDIKTYLPSDFSSKLKYKKPITMLSLMNHTAGFENNTAGLYYTNQKDKTSLKEALLTAQSKQIYEPGSICSYSNYGAALAGYVIQEITGKDFLEYETDNIFKPLNMKETIGNPSIDDNKLKDFKAKGYTPDFINGGLTLGTWSYSSYYPSGSVNGTSEDLAKFALALTPNPNENTPLFKQRSTLDKMFTKSGKGHKDLLSTFHGFFEYNSNITSIGHDGGTLGFSSQFLVVPKERFGVIILTNAALEGDITHGLLHLLAGKENSPVKIGNSTLPSSSKVSGFYLPSRINVSTYLEFSQYINLSNIKSIGENKIQFGNDEYIQVEPYIYKLIETSTTHNATKDYKNTLYFDVKDDIVKSATFGLTTYTPLSKYRTPMWLAISITVLVIGSIYFLISPLTLLIQKLINKSKKRFFSKENTRYKRLFVGLNLTGTAVLINNSIILFNSITNPIKPIYSINPYIFFNFGLLLASIVLTLLMIRNWNSADLTKKQKAFSIITFVVLFLFICFFINWKFFSFLI